MKIRIGTRGSPLALTQTQLVQEALMACYPFLEIEVIVIKTSGDRIQDQPLAALGGKILFTKEIHMALRAKQIDMAVHSLKDMEVPEPEDLLIPAVLPRESPFDALISRTHCAFADLPLGAVIGTCSARRSHQIRKLRPDVTIKPIRGNVDTRLKKLASGDYDALIMACAGLNRLKFDKHIDHIFSEAEMVPAAGQGIIALECRRFDEHLVNLLAPLNHVDTAWSMTAERHFVECMGGDCHSILGAHAYDQTLTAYSAHPITDHPVLVKHHHADAKLLGRMVAQEVKEKSL